MLSGFTLQNGSASQYPMNGGGVQIYGAGPTIRGNVVRNNLFEAITGNAVQIGKGTAKNVIERNEIIGAGKNGIILSGTGQVVRGNVIRDPGLKKIAVNEGQHDIQELE